MGKVLKKQISSKVFPIFEYLNTNLISEDQLNYRKGGNLFIKSSLHETDKYMALHFYKYISF